MSYTVDPSQTFIFMQSNLKEKVEKLLLDIDKEIDY